MKINQFQKLRQPLTPEQQDQKLKDVSSLYEKQFLREMMKAMRGTVQEGGGIIETSPAEKIFREQLDQEYVEKWGDKGGIGLANLIHNQLLDRLGPALGIRPENARPQGPIQINEKSSIKTNFDPARANRIALQYDLQKASLGEKAEITAPWSGKLLGIKQINPDEYLLEMSHDQGLKSQMVFRGQVEKALLAKNAPGQEIQAGQRLGLLSPEAKNFFWTVDVSHE